MFYYIFFNDHSKIYNIVKMVKGLKVSAEKRVYYRVTIPL